MSRRARARTRGFGAPLWWMDPPFDIVARIIRRARAATPGRYDGQHLQSWLRKVSAEADRRLAAAHIFVEGA